ncbi:glutathione S-transferase family protein [Marinomonas transparens]|uniref:Glutathione S-transferase family protein n=1 Tax=Marinomonas transparens TaxID=2795388 RepID=A0A934N133_9GAMM|nr:glutathione S-transferase family protein [Marinomonas transparens]MBJ7536273.1 glutathione S-transferase family protein [Marinomonas transparens]
MYQLFYFPRNASWAPHILLEEIGAQFELVLVDRKSEAQKSSDYLKLNPTGRIPTLIDGDQVVFESAAICLHLCEAHSSSGLVPDTGTPERTLFYQWLFYLTGSIQSELMLYFYPEKHTLLPEHAASISAVHETRITEMFALIDKELEGKEFLLGDRFSVCDIFLFMLSHWASDFAHPPLAFQNLGKV